MADKLDMIKGLEDAIQAYFAQHEGAKVDLKVTKLYHKDHGKICRDGMAFEVRVSHPTVLEV